ncbi:hypothetical protein Leryth_009175 [Lithospermum erythrorhizon]|nr:hypothetical protein Leryth_009175 [Lithospermum erythrorhizon]
METSLFLKLFRWSFLVNGGTWRSLPEWWDYISTQMVKHGLEEDSGKIIENGLRDINIEGSLWELRSAIWGRCKAHWLLKP